MGKCSYAEWEKDVISCMTKCGWRLEINNENTLGFKHIGSEWFRDFDKKTRRFIHGNGAQIINLVISKKEVADE